jgi:hypothetical protein
MKMGPDALNTAENESGSAKQENGSQRPWYRRKRFRERKTLKWDPTPSVPPKNESGRNDLGTVENDYGSAKHENGNRRPRYRRKRVRDAKHEKGT